ncbi:ThuA domain-containing protein [Luteolibacter ambystomatis]|uniref:ThuA domain-containing protein n=1 Tax=Luteolibacter ambystomatis TaxID=2824561 RepID=A0A975IYP9_9BACT|nr:PVC-type heme-binding CxxCH protein [Luteolibacter ambystomatis]QUE50113.1 ThuA domain-containing protein [Luteolibacter ambystomatis]
MKRLFILLIGLVLAATVQAAPLRVFIRGGDKTHGPNAHEHDKFLNEWKPLLASRGMVVDGAKNWPTAEQLRNTDVLVMYAQNGGNAAPEQKANLAEFTKRGGGIVVIHTAAVSDDPAWWKSVIGGSWVEGKTKWKEGPMDLYYVENQRIEGQHPITKGASNFHIDDEIYYDMDLSPDIRVLATSYTPKVPEGKRPAEGGKANVYDIQPQMWAYEKDNYRAFVSIPGHLWGTFEKPFYRAVLLRGIAWAGKRPNLDEFCKPEEISSLTYPEGGPQKPEETLKNLEVHPDFNFKLIAAEPLITKPMNFDWDASGRMWVAETPEYPNGRRGMRPDYRGREWKDHGGVDPDPGQQNRKAIDKISILTDTNGDGVMDKKEVFYEGLELVTGLVFYQDGVIVTQAPDILWLRDTDHDGKADKVEKLFTGLGTGDTHAVINNPRWGWDGWIYATQGYSGSDHVLNAKGEKMPVIGSGVVRFKPDGSVIEQYSSKGGNTWGLEITGDNRVMWTQPTSGELLMQTVLPEYALARGKVGKTASYHVVEPSKKTFPLMSWEQQAYRQIDWVGSFTAAAGCVIYDGGSWPAEYKGDYLTTEPTINIVHHARLTPEGSSYTFHKLSGREETEFIRSKDMWWRPVEVRVGPDGAVYLADFYNQAVIHNDTRGPDHNKVNAAVRPDRDHYFGRIWKIDHKEATKLTVPDLAKATPVQIAAALDHPNRAVRLLASRLLIDRQESKPEVIAAIQAQMEKGKSSDTRIAAMWTLHGLGAIKPGVIETVMTDADAAVRRNAAGVVEAAGQGGGAALLKLIGDSEAPVRLAALRAVAAVPATDADAAAILSQWAKFDDDFQRSAALGALARDPASAIAALLDTTDASLAPLASQLAQGLAEKNDTAAAAKLVIALASKPASSDAMKRGILDTLVRSLKASPEVNPPLAKALDTLLLSGAGGSTLPLAAKWDKAGVLKPSITKLTAELFKRLEGGTDDQKLAAARTLLDLRAEQAVEAVFKALNGEGTPAFKRELVLALGDSGDAPIGGPLAASLGKLPTEAQAAAFEVLLQRSDRALALLDALSKKQVDVAIFGPANLARLRTYPDGEISKRASAILDELMGPSLKAKGEILAKLSAVVEQPGDPVRGKQLFTATCAICHKYGDEGADIGPALTGMGSHGISELLTAIVDPNREVDPSFAAWNIETKDGRFHAGIIARENPASLVLKSLAGQEEIRIADIKSRVNTGRSLMPEGLEGLGGESLRDILAYLCGTDAARYRTLDLRGVFTADTRKGLYQSQAATGDTLVFRKYGTQEIEKVPFNVIDPGKSTNGNNILVLKGGGAGTFSAGLARKVEVKTGGFKANRLHFLGGVTGWGYQGGGDPSPVMKVTVFYADGGSEELVFQNGIEFADYYRRTDVPGSKYVDVLRDHQIRFFSKQLKRAGPIDRLAIESFATGAAPTLAAITAELADANAAPLPAPTAAVNTKPGFKPQFNDSVPVPPLSAKGPRVLLVGGGSSHDFVKFFGDTDKATLEPVVGWVGFTQNANGLADILKNVDVLVWSANQAISPETRKLLIDFANSGKGIVALHPGTWYAWEDFPQWNKEIIGGGTRGHDALGAYPMKVVNSNHPVTKGVTAEFQIVDELYNYIPDPQATPIAVLATATSPKTGKTFPQVFIVKHPKSRVVGITLGHDERAHNLPEYRTLLKNSVLWCAGK